jgi:hypothetical protein
MLPSAHIPLFMDGRLLKTWRGAACVDGSLLAEERDLYVGVGGWVVGGWVGVGDAVGGWVMVWLWLWLSVCLSVCLTVQI